MMEKIIDVKGMMQSAYNAFIGIASATYIGERPNNTEVTTDDFLVVSLPNSISNKIHGYDGGMYNTTCRIDLFVRDRVSVMNINRLDELMEKVFAKFPIDTTGISITQPKLVTNSKSDGYGFHFSVITSKLSKK